MKVTNSRVLGRLLISVEALSLSDYHGTSTRHTSYLSLSIRDYRLNIIRKATAVFCQNQMILYL